MVTVTRGAERPLERLDLLAMFEARKRVFVDLFGWDVPVLEDRYEVDQFDDEHAVYLIETATGGRHRGSARLLETSRPHILGSLFPQLCAQEPPRHGAIREITRFCLDRDGSAADRRETRDRLVSALVDFALANRIAAYVAVAEIAWLQQILAFGWKCRPLGTPQTVEARIIAAIVIEVGPDTPRLLAANGIYRPAGIPTPADRAAA